MSPLKAESILWLRTEEGARKIRSTRMYEVVGLKAESLCEEEFEWPLEAKSASRLTTSKASGTSALNCKELHSASTRTKHGRGPRALDKSTVTNTMTSV